MKMKSALLGIALCFVFTSNAQQLRAGLNFANVSVTDNGRVDEANSLTSFQVGLIGDWKIGTSLLSIQPGVVFTGKGSKIQHGTAGQLGYYKQESKPYYLEVPVNFVVKAPLGKGNKFFAGAGPYLAVGISGKTTTESAFFTGERSIEFSDDDPSTLSQEEGAGFGVLKRFDYGLNATTGLEGNNIVLGVHYGLGLAKIQSGQNNGEDNNNKHRVLSVTLGFKL